MNKAQSNKNNLFAISGQSLIEILLGVAIGAILIGGAAATITLTLRSNVQNKNIQTASAFAQSLLDKVTVFSDADWHNIDDVSGLVPGSPYYLAVAGSGFELKTGAEDEMADGLNFSTSFRIEPAYRNQATESIEAPSPATYLDPSTKKIITTSTWFENGQAASIVVNKYVTRSRNIIFKQSDWKGGKTQDTFPSSGTLINDKFDASSGIKFSETGALKKLGF